MQTSHIALSTALTLACIMVIRGQLSRSSLLTLKDHVGYKDYFCVAKCLGLINQKCNPTPVPPTPASISSTAMPGKARMGMNPGKGARAGKSRTTHRSSPSIVRAPKAVQKVALKAAHKWKRTSNLAPLDFGPPLNCSALSFVGMSECCEDTPREFVFSAEDVEFCHGTSVEQMPHSLVEAVWEYILNEAHVERPEPGSLDLTQPATIKKFGTKVCFVECLFKRKGLNFDSNKFIDFNRVATELSSSVSEEWSQIVIDGVMNCSSSLTAVHPINTIELQEGFRTTVCRTQPFLLLQCLRKSLLLQCPLPNMRVKSVFCDLSNQNLQYCDPFIY